MYSLIWYLNLFLSMVVDLCKNVITVLEIGVAFRILNLGRQGAV